MKTKKDCIFEIIHTQEIDKSCSTTPITMHKEALTELDSQHYIISFPKPTKVQLVCSHEKYEILHGSYFATIPKSCMLKSSEITATNIDDRIKGSGVEIINFPRMDNIIQQNQPGVQLNSIDLTKLHNMQNGMTMKAPEETYDSSNIIYHTTIPLYFIMTTLMGAAALFFVFRYRRNTSSEQISETDNKNMSAQELRAATFAIDINSK
ncbi:uncharacterized protein LOC123690592 [Pieris rapae]|uniref:uncharacterized protein LOC123690592 n=1 Tax=Pieris rapae TaxID=64459 RepID=UPI001E281952|nr:uncharacterized protein LOC123690592 [Pieris rapae]